MMASAESISADFGRVSGGGTEITSARKPGKNLSMRSNVAVHNVRC